MAPGLERTYDGEDAALSAFHSLCRGVRAGRFEALHSGDELWSLLVVITARKIHGRARAERAIKRGGGANGMVDGPDVMIKVRTKDKL